MSFHLYLKMIYRKIPIINPGLIFVEEAVLLGLFSGKLIFGGAYYWKEFCISKWVGLDNKTASTNSPWDYIWEGLLWEGFLCLRYGGLIFGRDYFFFLGGGRGGLLSEFYGIITILWFNLFNHRGWALSCRKLLSRYFTHNILQDMIWLLISYGVQ